MRGVERVNCHQQERRVVILRGEHSRFRDAIPASRALLFAGRAHCGQKLLLPSTLLAGSRTC